MEIGRFLCRDDNERRRMVDLARTLRPGMLVVVGLFMVAGLSGVPYYGVLPLAPPAVACVVYAAAWKLNIGRHRRPEFLWAGVLLFAAVMMAVALLLGRGPRGYSLELLSLPVLIAALIFPKRVAIAAIAIGVLLLVVVLVAVDMPEVRHIPAVAVSSLCVLVTLAVTALVIRDLDDASHRTAFVDELTGVLNRAALAPKVAELTHRARMSGEPVAVIVADIDHFKEINDQHGHVKGDAVLHEIARRLSACVSSAEPVYRLGGEEFIVLLPGLDAEAAKAVAAQLWRAVRHWPVDGLHATVSFGVAASHIREPFDFDAVFASADHALYEAKRRGRDRVHVASELDVAAPVPQPGRMGAAEVHSDTEAQPAGARAATGTHSPQRALRLLPAIDTRPLAAGWTHGGADHDSASGGSVTDELEREFVLDLNGRLRTLFRVIAVCAFIGASTAIPSFGWHPLIAPAIGVVPYYLISRHARRFRRPSRALFAGWGIFQTSIAVGFACSHGAPLFALAVLVQMVPGRCAVLRSTRAAALGTAYTALLMTGVALWLDAGRVAHNPAELLFPLALLVEAGYAGAIVGRSAMASRGAGIVDELTGLLNRTALGTRLIELEAQAASGAPRPVAVVLADLDHFKAVNDRYGHTAGDLVLREVAECIRTSLRGFDSAYRVGGEEFLLLLPDADADAAKQVAERLRQAVRSKLAGHSEVTISVGVAVSKPGARFVYGEVFGRADSALYEAKRAGRDRVCVDQQRPGTWPVSASSRAAVHAAWA